MKKSFLIAALCAVAIGASAQKWTGTWATAMEYTGKGDMPKMSLANTSVRQIVRPSISGIDTTFRMELGNEFGSGDVEIKAVYVAPAKDSCDINVKEAVYLTFDGKRNVVIPAKGKVVSDVCKKGIKPYTNLCITVCYGAKVPENATSHRGSRTTSYIAQGEVKPNKPFKTVEKVVHWYNISKIEVKSELSAIAVLGNSITDGRGTTTDKQNRWTDIMSQSLADMQKPYGVLNLGIGGNCVLWGGISEPAMIRFDRDILGQQNVRKLIIFEGINDIGCSNGKYDEIVAKLIDGYKVLIDKAHKAGMKVYGGTITPFKGNGWYSYFHEAMRQTVNEWIRTSGSFDGVIDFDQLVRNPEHPDCLKKEFSDDWLHLNPAGYKAMGEYAAGIVKD